ncbi:MULTISPECIES: YrzE family protein [unclassified Acidovorax]|uniref:YrzE family protein n=1 Tax=unclassified Acidovorax TaxID=2684926 RepID=UPI0011250D86|nr:MULTISPECIES: YrzE family protein [unclassified Acidovorax]MBD9390987.1 DUF3792 family protein [Acidovorax sp. ACV01]
MQSPTNQAFSPNTKVNWWSALVGSAAAIGGSAFLGTVVANAYLWLHLAKGFSPEQAYAQMGRGLTSTVELLSLATLAIATVFGGYVSALYGKGRDLIQGLIAGVLSTSFFFVMALNPASTSVLTWSAAIYFVVATLSGLFGGFVRAQRTV